MKHNDSIGRATIGVLVWRAALQKLSASRSISVGQILAILMSVLLVIEPLQAQNPPLVTNTPVIIQTSNTLNVNISADPTFDARPLVPTPDPLPDISKVAITGETTICPSLPQGHIVRDCALGLSSFEHNIVNSWLALRGLPDSASSLIYQYGRSDLRDELRSHMFAYITSAITKEPAQRNDDERAVLAWLQEAVRQNEIEYYKAAVDEIRRFNSNMCRFTFDETIAKALDLKFDTLPYCFPQLGDIFNSPHVPNADYFKQVGLKKAYGDKFLQYAGGTTRLVETQRTTTIVLGALSYISTGIAASVITTVILPTTFAASVSGVVGFGGTGLGAGLGGTLAAVSGPVLIVLMAVAIGVAAGLSLQTDLDNQAEINKIVAGQASAGNPPDLKAMLKDAVGSTKIHQTFVLATLPEVASTAPLPNPETTPRFFVTDTAGQSAPASSFTYRAYSSDNNHFPLTVQSYQSEWFLQNGTDTKGNSVTRFNRTLEFFRPDVPNDLSKDVAFTAYRIARGRFTVTRNTEKSDDLKSDDIKCAADPITGLTPKPIDVRCRSYITNSLTMRQGTGVITVRIPQPPVFVGIDTGLFTVGSNRSFFPQLDASNAGLPCALTSSGALPPGVTFADNRFTGTATAAGVFPVQVTANCGGATSTKAFTIRAEDTFKFVWPTPSTVIPLVRGRLTKFTIQTNAAQPDRLDYSFNTNQPFPVGMTAGGFNPDGTVTISGKPTGPAPSPAQMVFFYNPVGGTFQTISITPQYTLAAPTLPQVPEQATVNWTAGQPNSYLLDGSSANVIVKWSAVSGLPSWATFQDLGNNNAVISGTPPPVSSTQQFTVNYKFVGDGDDQPQSRNFTLSIQVQPNNPILTVNPALVFQKGVLGSGAISSSTAANLPGLGGTWTVQSNLPPGLFATPSSDGTSLTVSGTPSGPGGLFSIPIQLTTPGGTTTRSIPLIVTEPAALDGIPDRLVVYTGSPLDISISATQGFPRLALISPGDGILQSPGTLMTLPNPDAQRLAGNGIVWDPSAPDAAGRVHLTGTAIAPATYDLGLTGQTFYGANVPIGAKVTRPFQLVVLRAADLNSDNSVDCKDVGIVKAAYGKVRGQPAFNDAADINRDNIINIVDLSYVQSRLPKGTVCQ